MRIVRLIVLSGLLTSCASLPSCATFCDEEDPALLDPTGRSTAPLSAHEIYGGSGRRCVDVTIFDVVEALQEADRAP